MGESVRLTSRSVRRAGHRLGGIEDLDRAVLEADLRQRVVVESSAAATSGLRSRCRPARRVIRSVGRRMITRVGLIWPLHKSDRSVGQARKHSSKLKSSAPGPSAAGSMIDSPRRAIPSPFISTAEWILICKPGYCLAKQFLDAAADLFIHAVIEIGHQERGPDHAGDQAPLEPEPTEVDQALGTMAAIPFRGLSRSS